MHTRTRGEPRLFPELCITPLPPPVALPQHGSSVPALLLIKLTEFVDPRHEESHRVLKADRCRVHVIHLPQRRRQLLAERTRLPEVRGDCGDGGLELLVLTQRPLAYLAQCLNVTLTYWQRRRGVSNEDTTPYKDLSLPLKWASTRSRRA